MYSIPSALNDTAFRLPNGLYLVNVDDEWQGLIDSSEHLLSMTALGTDNVSDTMTAQETDTLIWSMSMIRVEPDPTNGSTQWPDLPVSAMECALFYCVNNYEATVSNGTLRETGKQVMDATRVQTSWELTDDYELNLMNESLINSIAFHKYFSAFSRTDLMLHSPTTGNSFNISKDAVDSISSYFQSTFATDFYYLDNMQNTTVEPFVNGRFNGYYSNESQIQYRPSVMQALYSSKDLNETFTALAVSMSNAIRTGADETSDGISVIVTGSKGETITFYRIVWPWISLHCLVVIFGIVFLGATIRENDKDGRAVPLWRSSALAIASRGEAVADILSGMQTLEEMWKKARVSRVTLFDKNDADSSSLEHLDFDPLEESES